MIHCKDVSFSYGEAGDEGALSHVSLTVAPGEVVLLCGESGCGKTTLTRLLNGLIPHYYEGTLTGSVTVAGHSVAETPLYDLAADVGSVFQNPRSQFFNVDTTSELAFGCENLGMPEEEIRCRLQQVAGQMELQPLLGRSIFHLSGGEKQKIACGAVSMLSPACIILDEPTSNLDVPGIHMLQSVLQAWKAQGKTIVIAEHRLWFMKGLADRVLYLKNGKLAEEYTGTEFYAQSAEFFKERGLRGAVNCCPVLAETRPAGDTLCIEHLEYSYRKAGHTHPALHLSRLELPLGQVIAVVGKNGAGKSTLVQSLCGLLKNDHSTLTLRGRRCPPKKRLELCFPVMQDVNHQLFTESVLDEVLLSMADEDEAQAEQYLKEMDLLPLKDCHPMALSGGQKQRVALASALAARREILILDEPTSGLDLRHMQQVAACVNFLKDRGKTVLIVTHDAELIAACCDEVVALDGGRQCPYDQNFFA